MNSFPLDMEKEEQRKRKQNSPQKRKENSPHKRKRNNTHSKLIHSVDTIFPKRLTYFCFLYHGFLSILFNSKGLRQMQISA